MKIHVTEAAMLWFQREMNIEEKDFIRFFARYGGHGTIQSGFSLGMNKEQEPSEIGAQTELAGVTFYIAKDDLWYFDQHDLTVTHNDKKDEIEFVFEGLDK